MEGPITAQVSEFYERHPYPPPVDDLEAYRRSWNDRRRLAEFRLLWPAEPYREDRSVLVAGCGTTQAAHYALRWPRARIVGIDVSAKSLAFSQDLKRKHRLENLELQELPLESAGQLGETFDHIVCTGVLHHLADPDAGLRALRNVLSQSGAMTVMVYGTYGRTGVYMLQDYCRRLDIGNSVVELHDLADSLQALPHDHPLACLLRSSPDFTSAAGLADALLHPQDRSYSVPELLNFLDGAGLAFGRWVRQAPYLPSCGALASIPHCDRLLRLPPSEQYAAVELFRGTMVRHSVVAYRKDAWKRTPCLDFEGNEWPRYIPIRLPDTLAVRERLPRGAAAVLINRRHTYTDLYLPIKDWEAHLLAEIDGERTIAELCGHARNGNLTRELFQKLWNWDQVIFDTSASATRD